MTPRTVTHSDLSLPCGCIVTVWPHGRGDSPSTEAAVTGPCKAHSEDVAATVRRWRERVWAGAAAQRSEAGAYERVLRLLEAEKEKSPETGA